MLINSHTLIVAAGLLSLGTAAGAQMPGGPDSHRAPPATRAELQTHAEQRFDAIDANKDGKITAEERRAHHQTMRQTRRTQMADRFFTRNDTDKNGEISRAEFDQAHANRPHKAGRKGPGRHHGAQHGAHMAGPGGKDGTVSRSDFISRHLAKFDAADTDGNGTISQDERKAAHANRRGHMRHHKNSSLPPPSGQ